MKNIFVLISMLCSTNQSFSQQGNAVVDTAFTQNVSIHFKLDLSGEMKNVKSPASIGIRGNTAPLSWDKTYPLTDEDKNGIYEATIQFEKAAPSLHIRFKYFHDTASWEKGNDRIISTKENELNMPVDKWNIVPLINSAKYQDSVELVELTNTITNLDSLLFDAYNNCKMDVYASFFSDDLEFYHDKGGLSTSKKDMVEAVRNNICNKVHRELLQGSIEVSPIPGFGAIEIGSHRFHNLVEKSTSGFSKFVVAWQYKDGVWKVTRVISLHK
ncbi:MAG: nuclear transport factor 2 family protein [Ferruginibacter sp.]